MACCSPLPFDSLATIALLVYSEQLKKLDRRIETETEAEIEIEIERARSVEA